MTGIGPIAGVILLLLGMLVQPAASGAAELRLGLEIEPDSIDPHFHNFGGNTAFMPHVFETLIARDAAGKLVPGLAVSWRPLSETVWEFKLRPGVRFSNGQAFTAEDVAFTFKRVPNVPNSPTSFTVYIGAITGVEIADPLTLRLTTEAPSPMLPSQLASIGIVSHLVGAGATTADYNTGKAAIGTGPYLFESWARGDRIGLARNPHYWGDAPVWDHVTIRYIKSPASRLATLLSGEVDLVNHVSIPDIDRVRADPRFRLDETRSVDLIGFVLDVAEHAPPTITTVDGAPMDTNPLADLRVRQAVAMAINRDAIVNRLMAGHAAVADQIMAPGQYGNDPTLKVPKYDPEQARRLLAAAGYPKGFRLGVACQNDRFVNDAAICQAVAQMLVRVGIEATPLIMPHAIWVGRANRHEFSMFTIFSTIESGEPSLTLLSTLAAVDAKRGRGTFNRGQYDNPQFDALLDQALATLDDGKREELLRQATRIVFAQDVVEISIQNQMNIDAHTARIAHRSRADGTILAMDVTAVP